MFLVRQLSLHLQNTLMYLYGMIFNLLAYTWSQGSLGSVLDPSAGKFDQFGVVISIG